MEVLIDQRVGRRSVGGSKGLNGLRTGSLRWGWLQSLNANVVGCQGVLPLCLR